MRGFQACALALLALSCGAEAGGSDGFAATEVTTGTSTVGSAGTTTSASSGGTSSGPDSGGSTGGQVCTCAPGTDLIYLMSSDAELWSFDPGAGAFAMVADLVCGAQTSAFSMAVDRNGMAWILFVETGALVTVDINEPAGCGDSGFAPGQGGFGLFGMSFAVNGQDDPCEKLYLHSYSGSGPFSEGPGIGALGVFDPATDEVSTISAIDFDGGELAGTGSGRLFAFAGNDPAKVVEYDKATGGELDSLDLAGFSKTTASAIAFHGGDFYLFTEAPPAACEPCLEVQCPAAWQTCEMDPVCLDDFSCVLETKQFSDDCGGLLSQELQNCIQNQCFDECLPNKNDVVSQVHRLDYDDSEGAGQVLTQVVASGPIRVVGAGSSTCVPFNPP